MNLMQNKLKLNIMIVSFLEKQIYMYIFLDKCIKIFFKPENYRQKQREKVFQVGKKSLKWEVRS